MSAKLTEAQLWLAHTPTKLPGDSGAVMAAILAEHRRFIAEQGCNQEITRAPVPESPVQLTACVQPVASDVKPRKFRQVESRQLAARLRVLRCNPSHLATRQALKTRYQIAQQTIRQSQRASVRSQGIKGVTG